MHSADTKQPGMRRVQKPQVRGTYRKSFSPATRRQFAGIRLAR